MYNSMTIVGRTTAEPTLRYTPNGVAVCTFTLAVDRSRKDSNGNKQTDFIDCVTWNKLAELVANHLPKGKLALAEGELQTRFYEKDGQKRKVYELVANTVKFLSPKDSSNSLGNEISFTDDDAPF